ncbi:MAG: HlyD family secretion protein [Bacteroidota bacterium]
METTTTESTTPKKKNKAIFILPVIIGLGAFFGIKAYIHSLNYESTDNAQIETNTLPVISRVSGYVDSISVSDFGDVKAGQLILQIDDNEYKLAVKQAQADLLSAMADLSVAQSNLTNSSANSGVVKANSDVQKTRLDKAKSDLARDEALFKEGSITKKQVEDSRSNYETTLKQLDANNQQLVLANSQNATSNAQIEKAKAAVELRQAMLDQAQLRLSYTKIYSTINGKIGKRNLEQGQYIQAGQNLMTVVNNDLFWIVANFKETQVEHLKLGQEVTVEIDGYPDTEVKGKIESLSEATGARFSLLPPDNASGNFVKVTQRVPVKISIENIKEVRAILKAGMSVGVSVHIK